jgi:uncharacterized protein YjbI with pentapeptide repeats
VGIGLKTGYQPQLRRQRRRAFLVTGATVITLATFVGLLWRGAGWLYGPGLHFLTPAEQETAIDNVRVLLLQLGAGVLATGALVYTSLTFRLSREGHVTDRFTKAIDQIGSDRLAVRVGGIYALERIMIDSARDHPTIVEVLAAFVREQSSDRETVPLTDHSAPVKDIPGSSTTKRPAADIQAALTVLSRRPSGRSERGPLNLHFATLNIADLRSADLKRADLTGADLIRADLTGADLTGADLTAANLDGAHMTGANLAGARLGDADLTLANLTDANLAGVDLTGADLSFTCLIRANMVDADLRGACLERTDLTVANGLHANDARPPVSSGRPEGPQPDVGGTG